MSDHSNKLQLLKGIESLYVSTDIKADILKDVARTFPETSEIRKRLDTFQPTGPNAPRTLSELNEAVTFLLPLYSPASPEDQQERQKDIETEVRLSLNEKFTKSPYFLGMMAMLAACITLFSFGLFSLNHDVKSADEQVNKMQQQVTSSAIQMNTMTANQQAAMDKMTADHGTALTKSEAEFNNRIQTVESRVTDAEKSVATAINTRFKQELDEVRHTKEETNTAIGTTQSTIVGQLKADTPRRLEDLKTAYNDNLTRINQRGTELYYNLQKPSWKDLLLVGFKINWPLWVVSLVGLVLATVALIRH